MKKQSLYFLFVLTLVLSMGSCTVEKRVHLPGYHIDWFGKNKRTSTVRQEEKTQDTSMSTVNPSTEITSEELQDTSPIVEASTENEPMISAASTTINQLKKSKPVSNATGVKWSEKKFEPFCISSTALAIAAFIMPAELVLFFFLAAFIAGVIGLIRVLRNRDRFRGMLFAFLGIAIGVLMFVGLILALAKFT